MGANTKIEWTWRTRPDGSAIPGYTFNPWIGCSKIAPGCAHCYAEREQDQRYGRAKWGPNGTRTKTTETYWQQPLKWNREAEADGFRRAVFCASLADVFEDWHGPIRDRHGNHLFVDQVGDWMFLDPESLTSIEYAAGKHGKRLATMNDVRRALFAMIDATPWLDWLLLTKRPENVRRMWPALACESIVCNLAGPTGIACPEESCDAEDQTRPAHRRNVWIGASASEQATFEASCKALREVDGLGAVTFLSLEPLLGSIAFKHFLWHDSDYPASRFIDWVIVGGESGPDARVCYTNWIDSIIDQCKAADVPLFVKQLGSNHRCITEIEGDMRIELKHKKGGDSSEWPDDVRIQQLPEVAHV